MPRTSWNERSAGWIIVPLVVDEALDIDHIGQLLAVLDILRESTDQSSLDRLGLLERFKAPFRKVATRLGDAHLVVTRGKIRLVARDFGMLRRERLEDRPSPFERGHGRQELLVGGEPLADRQVAIGHATPQIRIGGSNRGQRLPDRQRRVERGDCLVGRADLRGDLPDAEVGLGQLLPDLGVVAPLLDKVFVILESRLQQLPAQTADINRILLLEEGILADAGQVVSDGPVGQSEIRL